MVIWSNLMLVFVPILHLQEDYDITRNRQNCSSDCCCKWNEIWKLFTFGFICLIRIHLCPITAVDTLHCSHSFHFSSHEHWINVMHIIICWCVTSLNRLQSISTYCRSLSFELFQIAWKKCRIHTFLAVTSFKLSIWRDTLSKKFFDFCILFIFSAVFVIFSNEATQITDSDQPWNELCTKKTYWFI